uniref:Uncharacterized protein n=1 Tax=Anguilla anguilla TaxID=7936 RepID=A0A0E9SYA0_ANGAN
MTDLILEVASRGISSKSIYLICFYVSHETQRACPTPFPFLTEKTIKPNKTRYRPNSRPMENC